MRFSKLIACLLCVLCVGSAQFLWAQAVDTGTIAGVVSDQSGAVVPGATVTITDLTTGSSRTVTTNDAGRYILVNVSPGKYDISFTKQGFAAAKVGAQPVEVGKVATVNISLQVGATNQVVQVEATNVQLQTMNATVGNDITGVALTSLPTIARDVSTFVTLQPGVAPDGSVSGAVYDQNTFQLDGGQNSNDMDGSMNIYTNSFAGDPTGGLVKFFVTGNNGGGPTGVMPTPVDSVEEFKVGTNNQTADFNGSAGAQVSMVTKRGTNTWHGTGYEYYLDNNFNANTWDNNQTGIAIPSYHYSRFGGAIGGPILPKLAGGKTYFFANYEGWRYPNAETIEVLDPTASMRLGLLTFNGTTYNLNPTPVTYNGVTYPSTPCGAGVNPGDSAGCDPLGLGISPTVQAMWNTMPLPNSPQCGFSRCDDNIGEFTANMSLPQSSNFGVVRVDHDFSDKWHFMSSYRYFHLVRATDNQFDISSGTPVSLTARPQVPWYLVAGLTTNITPNATNDIHYSYLRNFWQWGSAGDPPQVAGLGGALEPLGEVSLANGHALSPYNVDTQETRTRFWDGQDNLIRDDVTVLKGNHLFQFGGSYERNFDYHERSDNGGGINYQPVYQLGTNSTGSGIGGMAPYVPSGISSTVFGREYAAVLGIVSIAQTAYTRSGADLTLNPPLTHAFDQSVIPYYNVYFSDTWHMKPTFTLTYGLGWSLEMPPVEQNGKQVLLVDASDQPIDVQSYLHQRQAAALQGQVFNPDVGFALVGNVGNGRKYPYNPFYGGFSPRIAAAWNPHFDGDTFMGRVFGQQGTVIRGGYSRIYGRLNGVDLVLVPLLGTGLLQAVQCVQPTATGICGGAGSTPSSAFRIGPTSGGWNGLVAPLGTPPSQTLPQPDFPGINAVSAGAGEVLDPNFKPNHSDSFDLTIQRQLTSKTMMEVGYIGRIVHDEYQPINVNAVPYMMTMGGQTFAAAYAGVEKALGCAGPSNGCANSVPANITPQPFFEAAMNPAYCAGFSSCTQAVATNEVSNLQSQAVWQLYSDLDNGGFSFPRSMMNTPINCPTGAEIGCQGQLSSGIGVNASVGRANYNALFASVRMGDWHGLTMQSNFTWSKALGTGATAQATSEYTITDPFNINNTYGLQSFDRTFVYNMFFVYQPPFFKGQKGLAGHVLGGWTFAPVLSVGSGLPLEVNTFTLGESYGEGDSSNFFSGDGFGPGENAVALSAYTGGNSRHSGVAGSNGVGTNGFGANLFADPEAVYNQFRDPILGLDTGHTGGAGTLRGLPYWNVDFSVQKAVNITERVSTEFDFTFSNVFNHVQLGDPFLEIGDPADFGVLPGQANNPRTMEFGFRVRF